MPKRSDPCTAYRLDRRMDCGRGYPDVPSHMGKRGGPSGGGAMGCRRTVNRSRLAFGRQPFRQAVGENDRVWRFMLQTNVSNSIGMFWMQLGTLAVGAVAGATEAGAFRLAQRLAKGITRPVRPVTVALYPELSRLVAADDHAQLRTIIIRVAVVAALLALLVVILAVSPVVKS